MKKYPYVVFRKTENEACHVVYVPDFDVYTQGETLEECEFMVKDLLSFMLIERSEEDTIPFSDIGSTIVEDYSHDIMLKSTVAIEI